MADDLIIRIGADISELRAAFEEANEIFADLQASIAGLGGVANKSGQEVTDVVLGMGANSQGSKSPENNNDSSAEGEKKKSKQSQWQDDLAQQQAALAKIDANDQDYKEQTLELDKNFWAEKSVDALHGSSEELAALKAEAEAEKRLYEEKAVVAKKAAAESAAAWQSAFAPVSSAMDSVVSGVVGGTQTMHQAMAKAGTSMAISYASSLAKMAANLAAYEVTHALGWTSMSNAAVASMNKELAASLHIKAEETGANAASEANKTTVTNAGNAARNASDAASQSTFLGRLGAMLAGWLGLETGKTGETVGGNIIRGTADTAGAAVSVGAAKANAAGAVPALTAVAAMGAASAVAPIPIVGPGLAIAAAGTMDGLGASQASLASAFGGWGEVPADGMLTELHKQEMVLPAHLANPMRAMLAAGPSYGLPGLANAPTQLDAAARAAVGGGVVNNNSSAGGDTHHYAPQTTIHMGSGSSKLSADEVGTAVASALRTGHTQLIKQLKAMRS